MNKKMNTGNESKEDLQQTIKELQKRIDRLEEEQMEIYGRMRRGNTVRTSDVWSS